MARTEVHVVADFPCPGIEVRAADDVERQLVIKAPSELGLSKKLVSDILCWQKWFDGVVSLCGFDKSFEVLGDKFDEIGQQIAKQVAVEMGNSVRVIYAPQGGWCRRLGHGQSIVIQE